MDVYHRFIEEFDDLSIRADDPVAHVVGVLFRAVKRAQMVSDGDLPPIAKRRQQVDEEAGPPTPRPSRPFERGSWRWDEDSGWIDYPSVQEAVDALYRHGGGQVRGWLAPTGNEQS